MLTARRRFHICDWSSKFGARSQPRNGARAKRLWCRGLSRGFAAGCARRGIIWPTKVQLAQKVSFQDRPISLHASAPRWASKASACSCAWYEERTSGPDSTCTKPRSSALLQLGELVGMVVARHRRVRRRRPQVLADRQDRDADARRSSNTATISSRSSPRPTMMPVLVAMSGR